MANQYVRRADDPRPGSGYRIPLPDGGSLYLSPQEYPGAVQVARAHYLLGEDPQEIADAIYLWVMERRRAQAFFAK